MRTYEQTHPWINFTLDLRRIDFPNWMLLGEARSKCAHIAGVPLLPATAAHLLQVYLAKGVLATTAIEGNTLSENDVMKHLEGKLKLPPSKEYLAKEIDNIIRACNQIKDEIIGTQQTHLDAEHIREFDRMVLAGLSLDEGVVPGQFRPYSVMIGRYRGAPHEDCEYLLDRLCDWLAHGFEPNENLDAITIGILKAIVAHLYIAWIHPFGDGNGRTARLVELQILLSSGVATVSAQLLSNHYNQTRSEYYRQLDQASQSAAGVYSFIHYALQGFVDGLRDQIEMIQAQQLKVHWENYIHDQFRNRHSPADERRRHLALDISARDDQRPIAISDIRRVSARIAEEYANKTDKTVRRDLIELERMGLIQSTGLGITDRREQIKAFLPKTVQRK